MGRNFDYMMEEIIPRNGKKLKDLHYSILQMPCSIGDLRIGRRGFISFINKDLYGSKPHYLHTSDIQSISISVRYSKITIVTLNTVYVLKRTNWSDTFIPGIIYTVKDIENELIQYLGYDRYNSIVPDVKRALIEEVKIYKSFDPYSFVSILYACEKFLEN